MVLNHGRFVLVVDVKYRVLNLFKSDFHSRAWMSELHGSTMFVVELVVYFTALVLCTVG